MKTIEDINSIMETIPEAWRDRWCGGERGPCACMGCVQIGNRLIANNMKAHQVDPERLKHEIPEDLKITQEEWELWKKQFA